MKKKSHIILISLLLVFLGTMTVFEVQDLDIWLHLRLGEHILLTQSVPSTDIFTHTAYGREWFPHHWLSSVFFYSLHSITGINGIIVCKSLILAAIFLITYLISTKVFKASPYLSTAVLTLSILSFGPGLRARSQLFTFLFLAVLLYLLLSYNKGKIGRRKLFIIIPLLFIFWVNFHLGFIFGLVVLGIFCAVEIIRSRQWREIKPFLFFLGLAIIGSTINPWLSLSPLRWFLDTGEVQFVLGQINEYLPLFHPDLQGLRPLLYFKVFFAVGLCSFLVKGKCINLTNILLFIIFNSLAFWAIRFIPLSLVVCSPIVIYNLKDWQRRITPILDRLGKIAIITGLFWLSIHTLIYGQRIASDIRHKVGFGVADHFPSKAVRFIKESGVSGNIFNNFNIGCYLIWNDIPVFIDGRSDVCGRDIMEAYFTIESTGPGFEELIKDYKIDYFLLDHLAGFQSAPIHHYLDKSPEWALIFWDNKFLVYIRRSEKNRHIIDEYEYRFVNPAIREWDLAYIDSLFMETRRKIEEDPYCYIAFSILGDLYLASGEMEKAVVKYQHLLTLEQGLYLQALHHTRLGFIYFMKGMDGDAMEEYKKAIRLGVEMVGPYASLGLLYERKGARKEAIRAYRKAIKIDPENASLHKRLRALLK